MHFATLQFGYFLALTLTVSWLLRSRPRAHKAFLLFASYYFYSRLNVGLSALLLSSSFLNFWLGEFAHSPSRWLPRKVAMWTAVALNLGLLGVFKYYGFFRDIAQDVAEKLSLEAHLPLLEWALPVGISFFTFQGLSYVVDLAQRRGIRAQSLLDFLLFIAYFPKLLMGPICRSRDLLPQLAQAPPARVLDLSAAMALLASGLFKKAVIATLLGTRLVDDAFFAPENHSFSALLMAAYAYSIQLYCDFSGYTDMARGVSLLLGYKLPENFENPYAATDLGLFWRRWHATFSSWLRDYVYFPLGGSRGSNARTFFNMIFTFTLSGLWHGASFGYLLWGFAHGVGLCVHKVIKDGRRSVGLLGREPIWYVFLGWAVTFHFVVFSRIVFKAADLETARDFVVRLFSWTSDGKPLDAWVLVFSLWGLLLNWVGAPLKKGFIHLQERLPQPARPVLWLLVAIAILALKPGDVAPYIYSQF